MHKLAAVLFLLMPLYAAADCTDRLQGWAKTLRPDLKLDSEHAVCKVNPANSRQILAALPFAENIDEDGQGDYGLAVLVAQADNGRIIAHHYKTGAISSDAIYFESLTLDTARYQLAPKLRAFGVRVNFAGSSRVNPFGSMLLDLYLLDGKVLRPVLNKLEVTRSTAEWDGRCSGEFTQTQRTVAIADQRKNGFASLQIEQKIIDTQNRPKGDDCERVAGQPATSRFTLDYDGSQYPVPKELSYP